MEVSSSSGLEVARRELDSYAKHWGLALLVHPNEDDSIGNGELLRSYLASSVAFVDWTAVYRAIGSCSNNVSLDQLLQSARKACPVGETIDKRYASRSRQPAVQAALLAGAYFEHGAKETLLYKELTRVLPTNLDATLEVAAFHLVGVANAAILVEDPALGFTAALRPRERKALVADLHTLHGQWKSCNSGQVAREAGLMIERCVYPVLDELGDTPIVAQCRQRQERAAAGERAPASSAGRFTQTLAIKAHAPEAWNTAVERHFAEDERFRRYKASKGWRPFYGSRPTLAQYFADLAQREPTVLADYSSMTSAQLLQMAARLAPHTQPALLQNTEQGQAFVNAILGTATPQQAAGWTTKDVAQRMLVAHHPEWQTHYSYAWNPDRTTVAEISAYLAQWPHLPPAFIPDAAATAE
jgi:hypothetical protein